MVSINKSSLWTITVSSITFIVSEGKFDRLINKLTTVTNYTRPTRFILRVLDCQKLYRLSVICIVYNWQHKVQFSRISCVVFCYWFKYCQRKTPPPSMTFDSFDKREIRPLNCERSLHIWRFASGIWIFGRFLCSIFVLFTYHGLRGSASPVLTATGFVNGRWQFSTPTESNPLTDHQTICC